MANQENENPRAWETSLINTKNCSAQIGINLLKHENFSLGKTLWTIKIVTDKDFYEKEYDSQEEVIKDYKRLEKLATELFSVEYFNTLRAAIDSNFLQG